MPLAPAIFGRSVNPIPTGGADYTHYLITCPSWILRPSTGSEGHNDMNEGRHDRKAYSDSVRILNLGGI